MNIKYTTEYIILSDGNDSIFRLEDD